MKYTGYTETMFMIVKEIIKDRDINGLIILINEQAEGKTDFLKARIVELKELCEKALKEIEDKDDVERK